MPTARSIPCGNIHEGNYPYIPALPSFSAACKAIGEAGGHVKAYIGSSMYDPGLNENAPLATQAKPNAIYDLSGNLQYVHQSAKVTWSMCYHTKWWQERLKETVAEMFKREHVGGIYFDTFFGGGEYHKCFNTGHGHSHGGGNDRYLGARKIAEVVRGTMKEMNPQSVISGEQPAETGIDLLDGFHVTTTAPGIAPLLATVYGDYICRGGSHLSPKLGDLYYFQSATLFTAGAQMGRLPVHGKYFLKDFPREMAFLRKLARHWKPEVGGRYLAYGRLLRPIRFIQPVPVPTATCAPFARRRQSLEVPVLQTGVFGVIDGDIGVFIVNISNKPISLSFDLTPDRYPLSKSRTYNVTRVAETGEREPHGTYPEGKVTYRGEISPYEVIFLEVRPTGK